MAFTESQFHSLEVVERVVAILSLSGTIFTIVTFLSCSHFRKLINRLIFYASFGNIFMSAGVFIAREGIRYGPDSPLCQIQAFLLHDFLFADAMWTFAMAINVYLVVFRKYDADDLKRLEKWYLLVCYGVPFIPALVFCFVQDRNRGRMFGSATTWCWISVKWEAARIISCYVWIWTLIVVIMAIYILVGREIWRRNQRLNEVQRSNSHTGLTNETPVGHTDVLSTEKGSFSDDEERLFHWANTDKSKSYQVTISYSPTVGDAVTALPAVPEPYSFNVTARSPSLCPPPARPEHVKAFALRTYIRTAFLLWIIFVITWMPSSVNRAYSLMQDHGTPSFALSVLSCITLPLQGFWNAIVFTMVGTRDWKPKETALARLRGWISRHRS